MQSTELESDHHELAKKIVQKKVQDLQDEIAINTLMDPEIPTRVKEKLIKETKTSFQAFYVQNGIKNPSLNKSQNSKTLSLLPVYDFGSEIKSIKTSREV